MLSYLMYLASCGALAEYAAPSNPSQAFFHLKSGYDYLETGNLHFTYNQEGFYIALRFYDKNDKPSDPMFLTANSPSVTSPFDSFTVTGKTRNSNDKKYLFVEFAVTNNENFPRKIDLGAYAKLATTFGTKYVNNVVKVVSTNGMGLKCTGKSNPTSLTDYIISVIGKNTDYPDITGYHYGKHEFTENDPTQFPYWDSDHTGSGVKTGDPIGISLHWAKKEIPGGETVVLGFVVTGDDFANFKPMVKDITETKRFYSRGDKATIKIEGTNYESEKISVYLQLPKTTKPIATECRVSETNPKCTLTYEITIPDDADSYEYTYWVKDSKLQESSHEKSKLPMSTPPKLTITKKPTGEYNLLDYIDIAGTISDDESKVYIKYQFDNGRINEIQQTDVTETGISFDVKIQIPKDIKPGNDRKLSIWLVDDDGVSIEPQTFTITVKPPTKPEIKSAFVGSKNRFHNGIPYGAPGDKVVLFGVATDKEANKELSLNVKFGDKQPVKFNIPVTEELEPFAVYFTIPQTTDYKIYDVEFEAVDFTGEHSDKKVVKYEVRDPTLPPPTPSPRPAKFVYSKPSSEEACFDLKYREENKADQSLTYKDEGFFVAYKIYNDIGSRVLNTTYIKKADNLESTTGDIHVKVSIENEPLFENYTRLVFNVTNNGYFNKIIDLGVFVDSMFANDDNNPISRRGDNLGFVVSGRDLYYTVFTNNFLTNIPVSRSYVGAVKRTNGKIENMPIFEYSGPNTETSSDQNSAYAFSWIYQIIKAETSVVFAVTLAPDKFIPTPSVIEDEIVYPYDSNDVQPDDEIEFKFKISDADINQLINVTFEANGQIIKRQYTPTSQEPFFYFIEKIIMPHNDYTYTYSIYATDASGSWASNKITGTLILLRDYEPNIVENLTPKEKYVEGSKVHITGQLWTYKVPSHIKWQWNGNSKIETSSQQYEPNDNDDSSNYDIQIPIPRVFKVGEEISLNYWVENSVGQKSGGDLEYYLTVGTKPVLSEVGFSVESASVNDQVVAYVLMSDKEVDRWLSLYYKFDDFDLVSTPIKRFKSNDSETPYGFFFTVPRVNKGQHTFSFVVRDEDDFDSEPYSVKLYVA